MVSDFIARLLEPSIYYCALEISIHKGRRVANMFLRGTEP